MLVALNPEEAEKKRNEQKIAALEESLRQQNEINNKMLEQLAALSQQNSALMSRLDGGKPNKKDKE